MATLSATVKKCVLHIYTPRQTSVPNFMRIGQKLRKLVVRDARFISHFAIICRYHGNTFCHCRKMCLAHLHPKANICAKFHENWWKTEEVVRDARLATDRPTARPPDRPTTRWFLYSPLYTTCMRGYKKCIPKCKKVYTKMLTDWHILHKLA